MSKSNFNTFWQRCVLSVCSLLLLACSSSDDNNNTTSVLSPSLFMDFPGSLGFVATTGSGDGLTAYGQAFWTSSLAEIDQLEFSINDSVTPFHTETSVSSPYSWQQVLRPSDPPQQSDPVPLDIGINSFNILAKVNGFSLLDLFAVTRGTSWMREVAIQYDGGRSRWLVLDMARGALLEVSLTDGSKTIISSLAAGEGTGDALVEPVDFVVDGDRALVIDRGAKAIIKVNLLTGNRTLFADTSDPLLPFVEPVAIEKSSDNMFVYIADRGLRSIVKVDITNIDSGDRSLVGGRDDEGNPVDLGIKMPIDLAYYEEITTAIDEGTGAEIVTVTEKLFVSDAAVNGIVEIDLASKTGGEFILYGELGESAESTQEVNYSAIRNTVITSDTLYVTDGGQRVIAVDLATGATKGQRTVLSGVTDFLTAVPNVLNLLGAPEALAVDVAATPNRLLVVDNLLGVLVAVGLADDVDGNSAGHRHFLDGGATVGVSATNNEANSGEVVTGTTREAPALGSLSQSPVDALVLGSFIYTLDRLNNRIIEINALSGERRAIAQNFASPTDTDLVDPATFQLSADGSYYIVDAGTDRVIQMPFSGGVRAVASKKPEDSSLMDYVEFDNPIDSVLVDTFEDFVLESPVLYVLDAGLNDVIKVVLADGSRSLMGLNLSCLSNPIAMLRNNVILTDTETELTTEIDELLIADQSSHELYSVDLLNDNACVLVANYGGTVDAIDIALDTRSVDPANYNVLVLDAEANAIVPVGVGVSISEEAGANNRGEVAEPYVSLSNEADEFILPVAMGFDRFNHRAYVLDSAIRSVFVVDLRWRVESTHEAVGVDDIDFNLAPSINVKKSEICEQNPDKVGDECKVVVDAQRVIISRGTALNCDTAVATCE